MTTDDELVLEIDIAAPKDEVFEAAAGLRVDIRWLVSGPDLHLMLSRIDPGNWGDRVVAEA